MDAGSGVALGGIADGRRHRTEVVYPVRNRAFYHAGADRVVSNARNIRDRSLVNGTFTDLARSL